MDELPPIILIEDDEGDCAVFMDCCKSAGIYNEVIAFERSYDAFYFLYQTEVRPFFIMCDMNMPLLNGPRAKE